MKKVLVLVLVMFVMCVSGQTYQVTIMKSITYSFTDSTVTVITNKSNATQKVKHLPNVQGIEGVWISIEPYAGKLFKYQLIKTSGKDKFTLFFTSKDVFTEESTTGTLKMKKLN